MALYTLPTNEIPGLLFFLWFYPGSSPPTLWWGHFSLLVTVSLTRSLFIPFSSMGKRSIISAFGFVAQHDSTLLQYYNLMEM